MNHLNKLSSFNTRIYQKCGEVDLLSDSPLRSLSTSLLGDYETCSGFHYRATEETPFETGGLSVVDLLFSNGPNLSISSVVNVTIIKLCKFDQPWSYLGSIGNPTLTDMTPHDLNLVVEVERLLRGITDPAYRALFVETVMVIAVILERNQELSFTEVVDFRLVIQNAIKDFAIVHHIASDESKETKLCVPKKSSRRRLSWPENVAVTDNWEAYARFASTPANIRLGTTSFLAKASIALLLHGTINLSDVSKESCCVS
ncbi:hypothetical protein ACTXT7_005842 [Hymenolepis weldensis]